MTSPSAFSRLRDSMRAGWRRHDRRSRYVVAIVTGVTIVGMCASALTPYPLPWRLLRFSVDSLFLAALLTIVATPEAMRHDKIRPALHNWQERLRYALRVIESAVLRFLTITIAVVIAVGLITAPSANAAVIVWRFSTAISAAIVLNSRLLKAFWTGGRALRSLSIAIAGIEIVALVATVSIDIPAILQSADLANSTLIARVTSSEGILVPSGVADVIRKNRSFAGILTATDNHVIASPAVADVFHFLGPHPFAVVLDGIVRIPWTHQSIACVMASNDSAPTSGYRSQRGVVDYVLPIYVACSPELKKLPAFIANLPDEATQSERAADIRRCGSVRVGSAYNALESLRGQASAQSRILDLLPKAERHCPQEERTRTSARRS
jgi:hypothetical protein